MCCVGLQNSTEQHLPFLQGRKVTPSSMNHSALPQQVPHIFTAKRRQMYGQTARMQPCRCGVAPVGPPVSGHPPGLAGHRAGKTWQGQVPWAPETRRRKWSLFSLASALANGINLG